MTTLTFSGIRPPPMPLILQKPDVQMPSTQLRGDDLLASMEGLIPLPTQEFKRLGVAENPQPDSRDPSLHLQKLPVEIQEAVLDHLFGVRESTLSTSSPGKSAARSWSRVLRHPRRKALSDLALVSRTWRPLVQDRIYRHIKIKGTQEGLADCADWFLSHPHLTPYVRHIEVWVPVWGNRAVTLPPPAPLVGNDVTPRTVMTLLDATVPSFDDSSNGNYTFQYASHNATLQDIFGHVKVLFPDARILTLEGGHCKKPPMIRHFENDLLGQKRFEVLPNIQTFVMRGSWNIMREYSHWCNIEKALPNVREWHCAYAKPKAEGYCTIGRILTNLPKTMTHVNISLEGFYNKEGSSPSWWNVGSQTDLHLCQTLGRVAPQLESLSYTGRICACFFTSARQAMENSTVETKLKSLDLVVKSCCRERKKMRSLDQLNANNAPNSSSVSILEDGTGITNLAFIKAFEKLTVSAVRSIDTLLALDYIRIRFIDLDSACPLLNPYFQLLNDECSGLWNDEILEILEEVRPSAQYYELSDGIYPQYSTNDNIVGAIFPRTRPRAIKASTYRIISDTSKP